MVIYSIKLYLRPLPSDEQPIDGALPLPEFAFIVEYVGVDLGAVLAQADTVIAQWLKEGRTNDDILTVMANGEAYRPGSPAGKIARGLAIRSDDGPAPYVPVPCQFGGWADVAKADTIEPVIAWDNGSEFPVHAADRDGKPLCNPRPLATRTLTVILNDVTCQECMRLLADGGLRIGGTPAKDHAVTNRSHQRFLEIKGVLSKWLSAKTLKEIEAAFLDVEYPDLAHVFENTQYSDRDNSVLCFVKFENLGFDGERVYLQTITGPKLEIVNGVIHEF